MIQDSRPDASPHGERRALLIIAALALLCFLPLLKGTVLVSAPFGDSHDGRNGAVWTAGSEALRLDPLGSRLGSHRLDGGTYANHPPAILAVVAGAELIGGGRPASARVAMLLALWSAIVLVYVLLRRVGMATWTSLVGCAAIAVTPMVRVYGSMVDTPMLGLPFFVCILILVSDAAKRPRLAPWHVAVLVIAPLVSWQLALVEVLVLAGMAYDQRRRHHLRRAATAVAVGVGLTFLWLLWAHGSLGPLFDVFVTRTGMDEGNEHGRRAALDLQWFAATTFLGPLLWFVPVCLAWAAIQADERRRWVGCLSLGSVILYMLAMSHGAAIHDYWNYWLVIAAGIGAAGAAEWLAAAFCRSSFSGPLRASAIALSVSLVLGSTFARTTIHEHVNVTSAAAASVLRAAHLSEGQDALWLLAEFHTVDPWVLDSNVPTEFLTEDAYRRAMRAGLGAEWVLVSSSCTATILACDRIPGSAVAYQHRTFELVRLDELGARHTRSPDHT